MFSSPQTEDHASASKQKIYAFWNMTLEIALTHITYPFFTADNLLGLLKPPGGRQIYRLPHYWYPITKSISSSSHKNIIVQPQIPAVSSVESFHVLHTYTVNLYYFSGNKTLDTIQTSDLPTYCCKFKHLP